MVLVMSASSSPIKVSPETKERIRYLAALADTTQAQLVDRAVAEYSARHAEAIENGLKAARDVLVGGDVAIASHLLSVPEKSVQRVASSRSRR